MSNRRSCCPDLWQSMGLPQGSILGLTLFSVYINEVALAAGDSLIHLYADDTILYTSGPSLDTVLTNLQTSLNAIQLSFRGLQLLLNASKTKCMLFNRSLPAPACRTSVTTLDSSDSSDSFTHCQTYTRKTDYPIDSRYQRCHLQNSLQHYSVNWMQSITVPSTLSPKPPTIATCMLSSAGPRYVFVSRSSTSLW